MSGVFTIEGAQVHESGIVVWHGKLTGFYMLVERAFVPLGRIWLYRDSALGFAIQPNVTLNGTVIGSAVP